ncbi:MAG: hypothetical protein E7632_05040 [Ruminococcaceae bacterium]|nr:hypothetical protein [Oscillospiraceae bacterium]
MNKNRTLALILAGLLTASVFSCGDAATDATDTTDTTTAATETEPPLPIPEADYGGADFNIYLWDLSKLPVTEENGDILNDAVYARNRKVEDLYNVKLNYTISAGGIAEIGDWYGTMTASIMAGDNDIQLAGGYGYRLASLTLDGNFANLLDIPEIDFSAEWWPQNIQEAGNLGGNMYMAIGNIDYSYYENIFAIFFNKQLADELKIESPYELVKSGKWTLDKLIALSELGGADLDGDSKMTNADRFGYITGQHTRVDVFVAACDIPITEWNSDGIPSLGPLSEKFSDLSVKLKDFLNAKDYVWYKDDANNDTMFSNNQGLFFMQKMSAADALRDMDADFGILPAPKWDEAQEQYYTNQCIGDSTTYIIPVTADHSQSGTILEALNYFGWTDVLPVYYEKALKGKSARDNESQEMLDIIFYSVIYDFTQIYAYNFGDLKSPYMILRHVTTSPKDLASRWATFEPSMVESMNSIVASLK